MSQAGAVSSNGGGGGILPSSQGDPGAYLVSTNGSAANWTTSPTSDIFILEDDFPWYLNGGTFAYYSLEANGNAGSSATMNTANPTSPAIGEAQLVTGTTNNGSAEISTIGNESCTPVTIGQGVQYIDFLINIPVLSNGTDTFLVTFGLGQNFAAGATSEPGGNAVYFQYDSTTSADWIGATSLSPGGITTASGGTPVVVATGYNQLRIEINAAATSVNFLVNGTSIGTCISNIPVGVYMGLGCKIRKTAGTTSVVCLLDYWRHYINLTTSRFTF